MRSGFGIVSICRNNLDGLQETLSSVLQQDQSPSEVLVVDGASSDGTVEWLAAQSFPPFVRWISEPDRGIYDAMNKGLKHLGDCALVAFLNAGDRFHGSNVLGQVAASHRQEHWQWAYGDALIVDEKGVAIGLHQLKYIPRCRFLGGFGTVPHQAAFFTPALLGSVGPFRLDMPICADQEHMLRCWLQANPHYLDATVAVCDGGGVGSSQMPGAFALQMSGIRSLHAMQLLDSQTLDRGLTFLAASYDRLKGRLVLGMRK